MSIASEITRINTNIANAYTACSNKGATLPATQNSANLASCIGTITPQFDYGFDNTGKLVWANPNIYLQSSGTQYIDTGIVPSANTNFVCDIAFTDISAGRFGALFNTRYYFGVNSSKFIGANSSAYNHSISDADTNRHIFAIDDSGVYIDNILKYSSNGSYDSSLESIFLFATHTNFSVQYYSKAKLYSAKITQGSTLVRHFVPVPQGLVIGSYTCASDGMWDIVNQQFYGNSGTGTFTYGR